MLQYFYQFDKEFLALFFFFLFFLTLNHLRIERNTEIDFKLSRALMQAYYKKLYFLVVEI